MIAENRNLDLRNQCDTVITCHDKHNADLDNCVVTIFSTIIQPTCIFFTSATLVDHIDVFFLNG